MNTEDHQGQLFTSPEQPTWHQGMNDRFGGRPFAHSAAEVAAGRPETVTRRVWRGQVAVLFPLLEDIRLRFVGELRHLLTAPVQTDYSSIIQDVDALELTHIYHQVRTLLPARRLGPLKRCLFARNELAHLRPLRAADLLVPDFVALIDGG